MHAQHQRQRFEQARAVLRAGQRIGWAGLFFRFGRLVGHQLIDEQHAADAEQGLTDHRGDGSAAQNTAPRADLRRDGEHGDGEHDAQRVGLAIAAAMHCRAQGDDIARPWCYLVPALGGHDLAVQRGHKISVCGQNPCSTQQNGHILALKIVDFGDFAVDSRADRVRAGDQGERLVYFHR